MHHDHLELGPRVLDSGANLKLNIVQCTLELSRNISYDIFDYITFLATELVMCSAIADNGSSLNASCSNTF